MSKKNIVYFEFIFAMAFFALPPVFAKNVIQTPVFYTFNIENFVCFFFALYLFIQYKLYSEFDIKQNKLVILISISKILLIFASLILISVFFQIISIFILHNDVLKLDNNYKLYLVFPALITGAFYEEILYRFYLPDTLHFIFLQICDNFEILNKKSVKNVIHILCEASIILLFALAHKQGGILSMLNAFACGTMLRIWVIKKRTALQCISAHFIYNLFNFVLSVL